MNCSGGSEDLTAAMIYDNLNAPDSSQLVQCILFKKRLVQLRQMQTSPVPESDWRLLSTPRNGYQTVA